MCYIYRTVYSNGEAHERTKECRSRCGRIDNVVEEIHRKSSRSRRPKLDLSNSDGRNDCPPSLKDRQPTPFYMDHQPSTPRLSSSRDSKKDRRREDRTFDDYTQNMYRSNSFGPSKPIPIPEPRRSSTLYDEDRHYYSDSAKRTRESRYRPVVFNSPNEYRPSSRSRRESAALPIGIDALADYGRERDMYTKASSYHEPTRSRRRHSGSPREVRGDDYEVKHARLRHKHKTSLDSAISGGTMPAADIYSSSPYGSYGSSYGSRYAADLHDATPPSPVPNKAVHWPDDPRVRQNEKINRRPRLKRSATISGEGPLPSEVKGILKNSKPSATTTTESGSSPAVQPLQDLHTSVRDLGVEGRETSAQRRLREERESLEDREWGARMRERISPPRSRRYSDYSYGGAFGEKASSSGRRRSEMFYPDEGRYRF